MSNSTNTGEDLAPAVQLPNFVNTHEIKGSGDDQPDLIIETGVVSKVEYLTNNRTAQLRSVGDMGGAVGGLVGAALEKTVKTTIRAGVAGALMSQGRLGRWKAFEVLKKDQNDNPFERLEYAQGEGQTIDHYAKIEFSVDGNTKRYIWRLQTPSETIDVGDIISVARRKNAVSDKGFDKKNREMKEGKAMAEILAPFTDKNYPAHTNHSKNVYSNAAERPKLSTKDIVIASIQLVVPLLFIAWVVWGGRAEINLKEVLAYLAIIGGAVLFGWWRLSSEAKKQKYPAYINQAMKSDLPVAEEDKGISQDIKIVEKELAKTAEKIRLGVDSFRSGPVSDIPSHFSSKLALPYDRTISTAPEIQVYTGVLTDVKERQTIVSNELAKEYIKGRDVASTDNLNITDQFVVLENGEDTYRLPSSTGFFREVLEEEEFKKNKWKMDYFVTAPPVEVGDVISVYRIESYESLENKKSTADPTNPNDVHKYLTLAVVKHLTTGSHLQTVPSPFKAWIQGRDEKKELFGDRKKNAQVIDDKWLEILNQPVGEFYKSTQ